MFARGKTLLSSLHPDAIRLNIASILVSIPIGYFSVILPIYFSKVGLDAVLIGNLYTVSSITSALLMILFGMLADRVGRKPFVVMGTVLPVVSYIILLSTQDPVLLTLAAALGGIGLANGLSGALATSSFTALLAEKADDAHRNTLFSLNNAGWTAALTLGSLLSGTPEWLQSATGMSVVDSYKPLFWLALILVLIGSLFLLPIRDDHRKQQVDAVTPLAPLTAETKRHTFKLSLFMGMLGLALGFGVQMLPLWFYLRFGASGNELGPWYAFGELTATLAMLAVPMLVRRLGAVKTVLVTQGISAFALAGIIFAPVTWIGAVLIVIRTTLVNMSWPVQQAYMMGIVKPHERATVSSITFATWGMASAISPLLSGWWIDQGQLNLPLIAGGLAYLASAGYLYTNFRHVKPPEELSSHPVPPPPASALPDKE